MYYSGGARLFRKRNVLYKDRKKERRRDFNERMNGRNLGEILSTITFSSLSPERVGRIFGMNE